MSDQVEGSDMSSYEKARIQNIKRNSEFLSNLGLNGIKAEISSSSNTTKVVSKKGTGGGHARKQPAVPTRRSGRVTVEKVKEELKQATEAGNTTLMKEKEAQLNEMLDKQAAGSYEAALLLEASLAAGSGGSSGPGGYSRLDTAPLSMAIPHNQQRMLDKAASSSRKGGEDGEGDGQGDEARAPVGWGAEIMAELREHFTKGRAQLGMANKGHGAAAAVVSSPVGKKKQRVHSSSSDSPAAGASADTDVLPSAVPMLNAHCEKFNALTAAEYSSQVLSQLRLRVRDVVVPGEGSAAAVSNDEVDIDVAKVTEDRITSTHILPLAHKLVVAAGDKQGCVGLWDVDHSSGRNSESGSEGVYKYKPHVGNVCAIHCNANSLRDNRIYTASYDGTVRFIDLGSSKDEFQLAFQTPEDIVDIATVDVSFSPFNDSLMFVGRSDGQAGLVDLRVSCGESGFSSSYQWLHQLHPHKINSIQQHPTSEHYLVTASSTKEGYISVHDLRKLHTHRGSGSASSVFDLNPHGYSINAANVSPNGRHLVSVSQDSTIKVWKNFLQSGGDTKETTPVKRKANTLDIAAAPQAPQGAPHSIRHDNTTGRWLSTFRPVFDPKRSSSVDGSSVFMMGSMEQPRRVEVFTIADEQSSPSAGAVNISLTRLSSDYLNSVCSRNSFHTTENIIAGGNSSGRVHIFR